MNSYERETVEFVPVLVEKNGVAVSTAADVTFSIAAPGERPGAFVASTALDGQIGFMINGLAVGTYKVWAKVQSNPEIPVIDCGLFRVV